MCGGIKVTKSWEEIVKVKSGEVEIVLLGKHTDDGKWRFKKQEKEKIKANHDVTLEKTGTNATFHQMRTRQSGIVNGWERAKPYLSDSFINGDPLYVHSSFYQEVWKVIAEKVKDPQILKWQQLCFPEDSQHAILASWMRSSKHTVIITGPSAAQSTSNDDNKILSVDTFKNDNKTFHDYYSTKVRELNREKPSETQQNLNVLQKEGHVSSIITEYTNGLHQDAGSKNVYELHGSLKKYHCHFCGRSVHQRVFLENRNCPDCGGNVRPSIVLLSEKLPIETWKRAAIELRKADLVIVIDTTLQMNPSNKLLSYTNGKKVFLSEGEKEKLPPHDLLLNGDITNNIALLTQIMRPNSIKV
jgi:NAD-dependent SIR2 family protein deacetylase